MVPRKTCASPVSISTLLLPAELDEQAALELAAAWLCGKFGMPPVQQVLPSEEQFQAAP